MKAKSNSIEGGQPSYFIWLYRHMRKIGVRTYPTLEETYYAGHYWLRKAKRLYPDRKYRFAFGQPVYVGEVIAICNKNVLFSQVFTTLQAAKERLENTAFPKEVNATEIRIAYEWEWFDNYGRG